MESNEEGVVWMGLAGISEVMQMSWQVGKEEKNKVRDENEKELNRQQNNMIGVTRLKGWG